MDGQPYRVRTTWLMSLVFSQIGHAWMSRVTRHNSQHKFFNDSTDLFLFVYVMSRLATHSLTRRMIDVPDNQFEWMNEFLFYAPTIVIDYNRYGRDRSRYNFKVFSPPLRLWKQQRYSVKLKPTFLSIVKTEESHITGRKKPTQSIEARRSLAHIEREVNPRPLARWGASRRTEPYAHPQP